MKRLLLLLLALEWGGPSACQQPPYRDARQQRPEYTGTGREEPEPSGLREVRIGYFGPADPRHPKGGTLWQGAALAIEEANREGGYKGLPFRLVAAWSENPWSAGAGVLVRLIYQEGVWALIGSVDGAATHLAEQVALKARLALVNPAATDRTIHGANVPWMFSCAPGDHLQAPVLVRALAGRPFLLVSATDHDSRAFVAELKATPAVHVKPPLPHGRGSEAGMAASNRAASVSERSRPSSHIEFAPGTTEVNALARRVAESSPQAVVIIAGARDSGRVVKALRGLGCAAPVLCGPSAGRRAFIEEAGGAAEGVLFPLLAEAGAHPDYAAAQAYDAARLVVAAIRQAGLNRARIRDAVRELSGWEGSSGVIRWDALGQNERAVRLGRIRDGKAGPAGPRGQTERSLCGERSVCPRQVSLGAMPRAFILR